MTLLIAEFKFEAHSLMTFRSSGTKNGTPSRYALFGDFLVVTASIEKRYSVKVFSFKSFRAFLHSLTLFRVGDRRLASSWMCVPML